ncbi:MAG: hypothetical protein MdMp024_1758 [Bacteroidales bacterium]
MKERLLKFLKYLGMGQTKFEEQTGLSRGRICAIRGSINVDTLAKIKRKYPELILDWMVMGEGEMLVLGDNNIQVKGDITGNVVGGSGNTVNSNSEMTRWLDVFNKRFQQFDERMAEKDRVIAEKVRVIAEKDRQIAQLSQTIQTLSEVIKKKLP